MITFSFFRWFKDHDLVSQSCLLREVSMGDKPLETRADEILQGMYHLKIIFFFNFATIDA